MTIDLDATITIVHSEKINAAKTWNKTFGFHPLLAYLDRPDVAGGEALAGLLRPGNAGSNTAADHVRVLDMALAALPARARADPDDAGVTQVLLRTDAVGATHTFAKALRERGCGFSLGFTIDQHVQDAIGAVPEAGWTPAYDIDGQPRELLEGCALLSGGVGPQRLVSPVIGRWGCVCQVYPQVAQAASSSAHSARQPRYGHHVACRRPVMSAGVSKMSDGRSEGTLNGRHCSTRELGHPSLLGRHARGALSDRKAATCSVGAARLRR